MWGDDATLASSRSPALPQHPGLSPAHVPFLQQGALMRYQPRGERERRFAHLTGYASSWLRQILAHYCRGKLTSLAPVRFVLGCRHCCWLSPAAWPAIRTPVPQGLFSSHLYAHLSLSNFVSLISVIFQFIEIALDVILSAKALVIVPILMSFTVPHSCCQSH